MATLIISFLAGLGITLLLIFILFATVISCASLIAIVRAAINKDLGVFAKIVWIVLCFIPGVAFLYFAFVDKNAFLKFTGWACIVFAALVAVTGGAAMQGAVKSFEDGPTYKQWEHDWKYERTYPPSHLPPPGTFPEKSPEQPDEKEGEQDDTPLSL